MHDKVYDIVFDSDGWTCRSGGTLLGSFPSWLLAVAATRAAVAKDKRNGLTSNVRYQDLKGAMHSLSLEADMPEHRSHFDDDALEAIEQHSIRRAGF
jgi:hypothetical protein